MDIHSVLGNHLLECIPMNVFEYDEYWCIAVHPEIGPWPDFSDYLDTL
jgi:hypothetical protein